MTHVHVLLPLGTELDRLAVFVTKACLVESIQVAVDLAVRSTDILDGCREFRNLAHGGEFPDTVFDFPNLKEIHVPLTLLAIVQLVQAPNLKAVVVNMNRMLHQFFSWGKFNKKKVFHTTTVLTLCYQTLPTGHYLSQDLCRTCLTNILNIGSLNVVGWHAPNISAEQQVSSPHIPFLFRTSMCLSDIISLPLSFPSVSVLS